MKAFRLKESQDNKGVKILITALKRNLIRRKLLAFGKLSQHLYSRLGLSWLGNFPFSDLEGNIEINNNRLLDGVAIDYKWLGINENTGSFNSYGRTSRMKLVIILV